MLPDYVLNLLPYCYVLLGFWIGVMVPIHVNRACREVIVNTVSVVLPLVLLTGMMGIVLHTRI